MRSIDFAQIGSNVDKVLETVAKTGRPTLIKQFASEDVVVMSAREYKSMSETLYLFGSFSNASRLRDAMVEAEAALPPGARVQEAEAS
jgi:antitoxin YefM